MTTEFAFALMEKILPDVVEILSDPNIQTQKNNFKNGEVDAMHLLGDMMPVLIVTHRGAMFRIIAALSEKTVDEVQKQDFTETLKVWRGGFIDEMMGFFVPSLRMVLKA